MKITQILKKISDRLPWWLAWVVNLIPIGVLTEQIVNNPEALSVLLGAWGIPTAYITFIVGAIVNMLKDSPVKKDDVKKVLIMSLLIGSFFFNVNSYAQTPVRGLSIFRSIDLDETEEAVKTTGGSIFGWYFFNKHASAIRYVKIYNATVANVTVGTTAPLLTIPIPPSSGANVLNSPDYYFTNGIFFDTAITIACTTGVLDNDSTAPTDNDCIGNLFYK